jgi:hypothetical protein
MAYTVGQTVQAADYNGFRTSVNTAWSVGTGNAGYGQPEFTQVNVGDLIQARASTVTPGNPNSNVPPTWSTTPEWRSLVNAINSMSKHQVGGADIVTASSFAASNSLPTSAASITGLIAHSSTVSNGITAVTGNQRLNAAAQGTTSTTVLTNNAGAWSDKLVFTFEVNFSNVNRLRYYFNAGGQISLNMSHSGSGDANSLFSNIASEAGQIYLSSTNAFPLTIAGQTYDGVTKVGGVVSSRTTINNLGFYQLTGTPVQIYKQTGSSPSTPYTSDSAITITAAHDGAGKLIFVVTWDLIPNGVSVSSGSITNLSLLPPSTANIVDTWGTPTVTTNVELTQAPNCITPTVGSVSSNAFKATVAYNGTITVTNATDASITSGLPSGITYTGAANGNNYVLTLTGTPTTGNQSYNILVTATNSGLGCVSATLPSPVSAGSGTVEETLCDTPVSSAAFAANSFTANVAYGPVTWTVSKATSATLSGFPTGITVTGQQVGADYQFTVSGTPGVSTGGSTWTALVTATNNCGGGKTQSTLASTQVGTGTVGALANCVAPTVGTVSANSFQVGVSYTGTITVQNATSATITGGLPSGITSNAGAASGSNYVFNLSGTPTSSGEAYDIRVNATNSGATCTTVTVTNQQAGSGTVIAQAQCAAPVIGAITPNLASPPSFKVGQAYSGTVTITNTTSTGQGNIGTVIVPGVTITAANLAGTTLTYTISGTPTTTGQYDISFTATNNCGGGSAPTTTTSSIGLITVSAAAACANPVIAANIIEV